MMPTVLRKAFLIEHFDSMIFCNGWQRHNYCIFNLRRFHNILIFLPIFYKFAHKYRLIINSAFRALIFYLYIYNICYIISRFIKMKLTRTDNFCGVLRYILCTYSLSICINLHSYYLIRVENISSPLGTI